MEAYNNFTRENDEALLDANALVLRAKAKFDEGNYMSFIALLGGIGKYFYETVPGEGHRNDLIVDEIHELHAKDESMHLDDRFKEALNKMLVISGAMPTFSRLWVCILQQIKKEHEGTNSFSIDMEETLKKFNQLVLTYNRAYRKEYPQFDQWAENTRREVLDKYGLDILPDIETVKKAAEEDGASVIDVKKTLFIIPMGYDGEPDTLDEPDYGLHFGAEEYEMFKAGIKVHCPDLPQNFVMAESSVPKIMHYQTILDRVGLRYMPLFSSYQAAVSIFGKNIRFAAICYETAKKFCLKENLAGIVIAPGEANMRIMAAQL